MKVGVEVSQVPEVLHEQDRTRPCAGRGCGVRAGQQARGDAPQLALPCPVTAEDRAQAFEQREHMLRMRHGSKHVRGSASQTLRISRAQDAFAPLANLLAASRVAAAWVTESCSLSDLSTFAFTTL